MKKRFFLTLFLITILYSCGPSKTTKNNDDIYISYEKNELICNSCLLLNMEDQLLQIIFEQQNEFHDCQGSYNYRLLDSGKMQEPTSINEENEYQLEYIDSKELSNCLSTILDYSIKNIGTNNFEVYLNNDKYRLTK